MRNPNCETHKMHPLPCPISYLLSPLPYLLSPLSYLLSPLPYLLSPISYLLSPISCLLSPISYSYLLSHPKSTWSSAQRQATALLWKSASLRYPSCRELDSLDRAELKACIRAATSARESTARPSHLEAHQRIIKIQLACLSASLHSRTHTYLTSLMPTHTSLHSHAHTYLTVLSCVVYLTSLSCPHILVLLLCPHS